jgi:Zn-dependent M28 family amino/carboxypeptidase
MLALPIEQLTPNAKPPKKLEGSQIKALHKIQDQNLPQRLNTHVEELCRIPRNTMNPKGMQQAVDYIKRAWEEMGLGDKIEEQVFNSSFNGSGQMQSKNVIVSLGPKDAERIIIGAHYDTCAQGLNVEEITNPGADDNASAVAGLLETGRNLKEIEQDLFKKKLRVDLVAYANEEPPHYHTDKMGSYVHAKSLKDSGAKVKGMICYEMIGYFDEKENSQGYLDKAFRFHGAQLPFYLKPINWMLKKLYPSKGNFISVIGNWGSRKLAKEIDKTLKSLGKIDSKYLSVPSKALPMIEMSDQWSYWKHGFPAVMITDTSFLRNPNYHKATDTPDTLNYNKMAEVVDGVSRFIENLI